MRRGLVMTQILAEMGARSACRTSRTRRPIPQVGEHSSCPATFAAILALTNAKEVTFQPCSLAEIRKQVGGRDLDRPGFCLDVVDDARNVQKVDERALEVLRATRGTSADIVILHISFRAEVLQGRGID